MRIIRLPMKSSHRVTRRICTKSDYTKREPMTISSLCPRLKTSEEYENPFRTSITSRLLHRRPEWTEWTRCQTKLALKEEKWVIIVPVRSMFYTRKRIQNMCYHRKHLALEGNLQCNSSYRMLRMWELRNSQLRGVCMSNMIRHSFLANHSTIRQLPMYMEILTLILKSYQR